MNEFEKLCRLATTHHWCWRMPCTTCGNHHLCVGLTLIAHGIPLDRWDHSTTQWPHHLIPLTLGPIPLEPDQSGLLRRVLRETELSAIQKNWREKWHQGEDWLGYLGVALARADFSRSDRDALGIGWRIQLDRMIGRQTTSPEPVTWQELEGYEQQLLMMASFEIRMGKRLEG